MLPNMKETENSTSFGFFVGAVFADALNTPSHAGGRCVLDGQAELVLLAASLGHCAVSQWGTRRYFSKKKPYRRHDDVLQIA